jgi:hypothetical protein
VTARSAPPLVATACLAACGGSSPEEEVRAAVAEYFQALRDEDAPTFCDKMFPSTLLASRIADRLTFVPPADSGGSPARWDSENRVCREQTMPVVRFGDDWKVVFAVR